jgi:hypothetical protein
MAATGDRWPFSSFIPHDECEQTSLNRRKVSESGICRCISAEVTRTKINSILPFFSNHAPEEGLSKANQPLFGIESKEDFKRRLKGKSCDVALW